MKTILLLIAGFIATTSSLAAGTSAAGRLTCKTKSGTGIYLTGGNTVLAVTLSSFNGTISASQEVNLSWVTMMEANVDHFEIERSGDGMNFQDLDSVASKVTISTSDYQLTYNYADLHPLIGISYYRIKVVGKNGYTNQSTVIQITNSPDSGTRIYPTLIQNNMVFVESDKSLQTVKMEFFDLSGKKISETYWESLNGRQNAQISKSGILPTGTYIARLTAGGQNIKTQLVIVQSL